MNLMSELSAGRTKGFWVYATQMRLVVFGANGTEGSLPARVVKVVLLQTLPTDSYSVPRALLEVPIFANRNQQS